MYTLLYLKWTTSKDLRRVHGTLLNVTCQSGWEGCLKEMDVYMHGWDPYCSPEVTTTLFIGHTPIQNVFAIKKKNCMAHLLPGNYRPSHYLFSPSSSRPEQPHPPSPPPWREQACGNREQAGWSPSDNMDLKLNFPQELQMVEGEESQIITKNLLYDPPTSASLSVVAV